MPQYQGDFTVNYTLLKEVFQQGYGDNSDQMIMMTLRQAVKTPLRSALDVTRTKPVTTVH